MPSIKIKTPDGKTINLTAPYDASPEQIHQMASMAAEDYKSKLPKESPETQNQEQTIASLTKQGIDPAVVNIQKQKLDLMKAGKELPPSLKPTSEGFDAAGEMVAEKLGEKGHPIIGGVSGGIIANAPDIAMAAGSVAPMLRGAKAVGPFVKAVIPGAKKAVGAAIGEAEKAAGYVKKIPTVQNMAKRLGLPTGEKGYADIVNKMSERLASGDKIPVQDLVDFRALSDHMLKTGKVAVQSRIGALVSDAVNKSGTLLNESVKGRAALASEYAKISKVQNVLKKLAAATGAGAAATGMYAGMKSLLK